MPTPSPAFPGGDSIPGSESGHGGHSDAAGESGSSGDFAAGRDSVRGDESISDDEPVRSESTAKTESSLVDGSADIGENGHCEDSEQALFDSRPDSLADGSPEGGDDPLAALDEAPETGDPDDLTLLLRLAKDGDKEAAETAITAVYGRLLGCARAVLGSQKPDRSLSATDLAHEAYAKLFSKQAKSWNDRIHFFRAAAMACRTVIADHARRKQAIKREEPAGERVPEDLIPSIDRLDLVDRLALEDALVSFEQVDSRAHDVAQLRIYLGFSIAEVASVTDTGERTIRRDWEFANAWLSKRLDQ